MSTDNVAFRYHAFLMELAAFQPTNGNSCLAVWPDFISSRSQRSGDESESLRTFDRARQTAAAIAEALADCPGGESFAWAITDLIKLEDLFKWSQLGQPWAGMCQAIDSGTLNSVKAIGSLFDVQGVMPTLPLREIESILELLDELRSEIKDSDIDPSTKARLSSKLDEIDAATREATMFGTTTLRRTVLTVAAELKVEAFLTPHDAASPVVGRFAAMLARLADVLGILAFAGLSLTPGSQPEPPAISPTVKVELSIDGSSPTQQNEGDLCEAIVDAEIIDP